MTVAGYRSLLVGDEPIPARGPDAISVLDTTELRWFVPGPLPLDVRKWFTGSTGAREERCDTYLLDGRCDVGVKRRFRETLELKLRRSLAGQIEFSDGLAGSLEVWRRWSPGDGLVENGSDGRWADVCKSIVKRRFSIDGSEIAFSPNITGAGCDVEVADVSLGPVRAWTFAFAAFGPRATRRDALLVSWQELERIGGCPEPFGPRNARAMGYPEWIARTVSTDLRDHVVQRPMASSF